MEIKLPLMQEGSVQLFFKTQSSNVGFSTFLELNKDSNGRKS